MIEQPKQWFVFNGKASSEFGAYVSGDGTFPSAEKIYETVEVPGRSGDLYIDSGRYSNVTVEYSTWIAEDLEHNLNGLGTFLGNCNGYQKLEDTYHPEYYRYGVFRGGISPSVALLSFASFTLSFDCKPQKFLKIGDEVQTFTTTGTIYNPTAMEAAPLIRVYGTGFAYVGSYEIHVTTNDDSYIVIDSELMDCYTSSGNNANSYVGMANGFPKIPSGSTTVTVGTSDTNITKLEIIPRWWML